MAATPNSPYTPLQKPVYVKPKPPQGYRQTAAQRRLARSYVRRRRKGTRFFSPDPGYRSSPKRGFRFTGKTGVNAVGGPREGQRYRVFQRNGVFYHVYGRGPEARKVRLRPEVARQYGYTGGTPNS